MHVLWIVLCIANFCSTVYGLVFLPVMPETKLRTSARHAAAKSTQSTNIQSASKRWWSDEGDSHVWFVSKMVHMLDLGTLPGHSIHVPYLDPSSGLTRIYAYVSMLLNKFSRNSQHCLISLSLKMRSSYSLHRAAVCLHHQIPNSPRSLSSTVLQTPPEPNLGKIFAFPRPHLPNCSGTKTF